PQPISLEQTRSVADGLVAKLEEQAAAETNGDGSAVGAGEEEPEENGEQQEAGEQEQGQEEDEEEESEDDDIEIIMEPQSRSLDFRNQPGRPPAARSTSATFSTPQRAPPQQQPSLTTEYTPRERGAVAKPSSTPQPSAQAPATQSPLPAPAATPGTAEKIQAQEGEMDSSKESGPDPSTLPPAKAPPSHPSINPSAPGTVDGRSILEYDLNAMAEKPWRRPGSDLSDWFNYGFDEISWEAYCYRRRELGELATMLKSNVLGFAGMPEDQLIALPPEVRTMVMAGATAVMANGGGGGPGGGGMIPPGAGMNMNGGMMNQMMGMGQMMNPMMDMNMGDMGMMQDGSGGGGGPQGGGQEGMGMNVGGFVSENGGPGMMGMGMGEFGGMQDPSGMGQQMYPGMDGSGTPTPVAPTRGVHQGQFRGRGMGQGLGLRGRGAGFAGRGRGTPVRPASPLPPNVPTGPRNKNKYKDIDGSAPAVDGLDYGGGGGGGGGNGERERSEREHSRGDRKERGTPDAVEETSTRSSRCVMNRVYSKPIPYLRTSRKRRGSTDRDESRSSKRR
ncbi:Pre-mRNA polyadenylation factor fip1, partial [Trametes pubescens]